MKYFNHWSTTTEEKLNFLNSLPGHKTLAERNRLNELDNLLESSGPLDLVQTLDDVFNYTLEAGTKDSGSLNPQYVWMLHSRLNHIKEMILNIYQFEKEDIEYFEKRKEAIK